MLRWRWRSFAWSSWALCCLFAECTVWSQSEGYGLDGAHMQIAFRKFRRVFFSRMMRLFVQVCSKESHACRLLGNGASHSRHMAFSMAWFDMIWHALSPATSGLLSGHLFLCRLHGSLCGRNVQKWCVDIELVQQYGGGHVYIARGPVPTLHLSWEGVTICTVPSVPNGATIPGFYFVGPSEVFFCDTGRLHYNGSSLHAERHVWGACCSLHLIWMVQDTENTGKGSTFTHRITNRHYRCTI